MSAVSFGLGFKKYRFMLKIKKFGVCNLSVAPVRAANSDAAEIVTQLLFGDLVEIIEAGQPWIKINFPADDYEGWMDFKQLTYIDEDEYRKLAQFKAPYLTEPQLDVIGPRGKQTLLFGARLTGFHNGELHFGGESYTFSSVYNQTKIVNPSEAAIYFLNAPYLWGGKSLFGIDCSGLVQNCFKVSNQIVPRDASEQVHHGELVAYANRQVGDVPFFINKAGKVHHVGLLIEKDKIIHAAGCVRIDAFDEKGIYRDDLGNYTHHFHSIRRY